jgi:hypothetical protein
MKTTLPPLTLLFVIAVILISCVKSKLLVPPVEPWRDIQYKDYNRWQNCSTIQPPSELSNPPPYYGFGCDSIGFEYL